MKSDVAVVILAAGLGTRMQSDKAKVLHELHGKPMIEYVLETSRHIADTNIIVVVGHEAEQVKAAVLKKCPAEFAFQEKQLGTGHAVQCAMPLLKKKIRTVLILYGDVPLLMESTIIELIEEHVKQNNDLTLVGVRMKNPEGYGRIITDSSGALKSIVEEKDANDRQRSINLVNSGIYCAKRAFLEDVVYKIKNDNAQREYYLTDIVRLGNLQQKKIGFIMAKRPDEVLGVNTLEELKRAENLISTT